MAGGTRASLSPLGIRGMVCPVRLDGKSLFSCLLLEVTCDRSFLFFPYVLFSAEVVAQMIMAELANTVWTQPEWLPTRYLTWEERQGTVVHA